MEFSGVELMEKLVLLGMTKDVAEIYAGEYESVSRELEEKQSGRGTSYRIGVSETVNALIGSGDVSEKANILKYFWYLENLRTDGEYSFFEVLSEPFQAEERLQLCGDMLYIMALRVENMEDVLAHMAKYGRLVLYKSSLQNRCSLMTRRLNWLRCFVHSVAANYPDYAGIQITGADAHRGGRQPLVITKADGSKIVYKPRSVDAENLVCRVIARMNEYFANNRDLQDMGLPEMNADSKETPGGAVYGEVDFLTKKERMPEEEAKLYYRKLGALICVAKLLGLTDLHQDNIMATEGGPVILDVECIFDRRVLTDGKVAATCLSMALEQEFGDGSTELANAAFYIGESGKKSTDLFRTYTSEVCAGVWAGIQAVREKSVDILNEIAGEKGEVVPRTVRWVPIATQDLYDFGTEYWNQKTLPCLDGAVKQFMESLRAIPGIRYERKREMGELLCTLLAESFEKGDIPYFTISYQEKGGNIALDGQKVLEFEYRSECDTLNRMVLGNVARMQVDMQSEFWLDFFRFFGGI